MVCILSSKTKPSKLKKKHNKICICILKLKQKLYINDEKKIDNSSS